MTLAATLCLLLLGVCAARTDTALARPTRKTASVHHRIRPACGCLCPPLKRPSQDEEMDGEMDAYADSTEN